MNEPEDRELIARFRAGDRSAFDRLVRRYGSRVAGVARRYLGDRDEALDVAQEVFVEAFRMLPRWKEEGLLFSWLYRTALNIASHRLRRRRKMSPVDAGLAERPAPGREPGQGEIAEAVREALETLPPRQRDVFILRHEEGLPMADVARRLGLAPGTAKAHLHRALAALRDALRGRKLL